MIPSTSFVLIQLYGFSAVAVRTLNIKSSQNAIIFAIEGDGRGGIEYSAPNHHLKGIELDIFFLASTCFFKLFLEDSGSNKC